MGAEGKENGVVMLRVRTASLFSSQCSEIISKVNVSVYFRAEMRGSGSRVIETCSTVYEVAIKEFEARPDLMELLP